MKCPRCSREISIANLRCTNCGYPTEKILKYHRKISERQKATHSHSDKFRVGAYFPRISDLLYSNYLKLTYIGVKWNIFWRKNYKTFWTGVFYSSLILALLTFFYCITYLTDEFLLGLGIPAFILIIITLPSASKKNGEHAWSGGWFGTSYLTRYEVPCPFCRRYISTTKIRDEYINPSIECTHCKKPVQWLEIPVSFRQGSELAKWKNK